MTPTYEIREVFQEEMDPFARIVVFFKVLQSIALCMHDHIAPGNTIFLHEAPQPLFDWVDKCLNMKLVAIENDFQARTLPLRQHSRQSSLKGKTQRVRCVR
jgi:hypothetical protein